MADLAERVKPGDRFFLADEQGFVCYRGTMNADGTALMDVIGRRGVEPVTFTAQELYDLYDPAVFSAGTIGQAV